jgi:pyruvate-formate lyase
MQPTSARITNIRNQAMERKGSWIADPNPFERDVALARTGASLSVVQTRARMLLELVRIATLRIYPGGWTLAGEHLPHAFGGSGANAPARSERLAELGVPASEAEGVAQLVRRWEDRARWFSSVGSIPEPLARGLGTWEKPQVFLAHGWMENHSIRDYAKVLRIGFRGISGEIERASADADCTEPEYPERSNFWQAARWICDAGELLGSRYAALARDMGLADMAAACECVPARGARTLREAVQALWLAHILTCGEDGINANSIGRLDQILQPYYRADLEAGRVTRADAVELMEELACKLYLEYDVQAITLAGTDADGANAVNDMSWIILEATGNLGFVRDLSVRIAPSTPRLFVEQCAIQVARGGGIPFFFNDSCFIEALAERGISLEDARDYAPIGCIELTIPGKANPHAVSGWINAAKCLELALFDGRDPGTDLQLGPRTGGLADHATFESFRGAFWAQLEHFSRSMVSLINRGELAQREQGPLPCWSVLTDDCIQRGRDITDGGALYNYHSVCLLGVPNAADSLAALRALVFQGAGKAGVGSGAVGPSELLEALRTDFQGREELRQQLLRGAPKYGNDIDEVDALAAWLAGAFIDLMDRFRTPLGGRFFVHLFSFLQNVGFGKQLGATPDGRRAGEPLAYSISAQQGRDERGVTALLSSIAKLPHRKAAGATAAIIDLDPKMAAGDEGSARLAHLILAAMDMGVGQMQLNVVSADRLRLAREDPEHYGNIPVRVAGYSQMFRLLDKPLQEHVIARTKHAQ